MLKTTTFCLLAALVFGNATTASAQFTQNGQRLTVSVEDDWKIDPNTGNGAWQSTARSTYTYPSTTNAIVVLEQRDPVTNAFKNISKFNITINANNSFNNFILQSWTNNTWVNSFRNTYTYYNNDPQKELQIATDTATAGVFAKRVRTMLRACALKK
jgi:hypothetical protein